jgi:hypothetical protein
LFEIYPEIYHGLDRPPEILDGLPKGIFLENEKWKEYKSKYFEDDSYYEGWESPKVEARSIKINNVIVEFCRLNSTSNSELKKAMDIGDRENLQSQKQKSERDSKFLPILSSLNKKAETNGLGNYKEYLQAQSTTGKLIVAGASYSLTGASRDVQSASCSATVDSTWMFGEPGGYWSCYIDFIGGSEFYSIEFVGDKWSGRPGTGASLVEFKTTSAFDTWFSSYDDNL